jgi:hypothetical protein
VSIRFARRINVDKEVRRITVVTRTGDTSQATVVYKDSTKERKVSDLSAPFEKVVRRLMKAQAIGSVDALRRHEKSNSERRDGWIRDAPVNLIKSTRKSYNEARKIAPFGILPKA